VGGSEPQATPVSFNDAAVSAAPIKQKPKLIQLIVIGAALVVLIGASAAGFLLWKSNQLALETYKGEGYSLLVPSDYIESEEDGGVVFKEDVEEETTQSSVLVTAQEFGDITQEEFEEVKKDPEVKNIAKEILEQGSEDGEKIENVACTDTMSETQIVFTCSADMEKDDKKVKLHYRLVIDKNNGLGIVGVAVHDSDKNLEKKSQEIMDSFKFE
jgi:hypothetical protein